MPKVTELLSDNQDLNPGSLALKAVLFFYHVIPQGQEGPTDRERYRKKE